MRVVEGKLDYSRMDAMSANTCVLFTGNSTIKHNGALVMGRGAAKQVRDLFPGIDRVFGRRIEERLAKVSAWYGLVWIKGPAQIIQNPESLEVVSPREGPIAASAGSAVTYTHLPRTLGCFQVKEHFKDNAELNIIEYSAFMLGERARRSPELGFRMNYPGIGWGHLTEDQVAPILSRHLPDNVVLHK